MKTNRITRITRRLLTVGVVHLLIGISAALAHHTLSNHQTSQTSLPTQPQDNEDDKHPVVHFIALSSAYEEQQLDSAYKAYQEAGYQINTKYLRQEVSDLGYTDIDLLRAQLLIQALTDDEVDILWGVRGGGGALNLLPHLKKALPMLKQAKPKVLVGYSDMSALHFFIAKYLPNWRSIHGNVAIHSKQVDQSPRAPSINDLEPIPNVPQILDEGVYYDTLLPLNSVAWDGEQGVLIGGNLELMRSTFGTEFSPDFNGKIVFLEDIGITYRQLDRMLNQLLMHKEFAQVKGVVMGQFFSAQASDAQRSVFKRTVENFAKQFPKPVYYYPNIGHGRKNSPLVVGGEATIVCQQQVYCQLYQISASSISVFTPTKR